MNKMSVSRVIMSIYWVIVCIYWVIICIYWVIICIYWVIVCIYHASIILVCNLKLINLKPNFPWKRTCDRNIEPDVWPQYRNAMRPQYRNARAAAVWKRMCGRSMKTHAARSASARPDAKCGRMHFSNQKLLTDVGLYTGHPTVHGGVGRR